MYSGSTRPAASSSLRCRDGRGQIGCLCYEKSRTNSVRLFVVCDVVGVIGEHYVKS